MKYKFTDHLLCYRKLLLGLLCTIFVESSFACINEYNTLLSGEVVYEDRARGRILNESVDVIELKRKARRLLAAYKRSDSLQYYSDYAATIMYLGDYQEAKQIYLEIERKYPGWYRTASNLGTVYELIGKPDSALIWIKKSVEIYPNSHGGSEWIHIKILEYQLSKKQNSKRSILGLYFGTDAIPVNQNKYDLSELQRHIWLQLHERLKFVKPRNEIVGNLYFDFGNILAQTSNVQSALESYEAAREYGFESELMNKRTEAFEILDRKAELKGNFYEFVKDNVMVLFVSAIAVFVISLMVIGRLVSRRRKRKSSAH